MSFGSAAGLLGMTDDRSHEFTDGLFGHITHTDFASTDPGATKVWAVEVLGWSFQPPFPTPGGLLIGFSGPTV